MSLKFELELENLLYRYGYRQNVSDAAYWNDPDGEDAGKLLEAVRDALERHQ